MPYQMTVTLAEERVREMGHVGRRVSSEADLIRMLRALLPGWDIDTATTDRGETQDEVIGSWGRPGLIVYDYPQLASISSGGYSDALAGITVPEGMSGGDRVFMFLYQDISEMNELIVIHEVAHALTFDFDAGHSERWLDTYLEMLKKAGLQEAVNLISFMTGKSEIKFVEGARRQAAFYEPWEKPARAIAMADSFADVKQGFARAHTEKEFRLTEQGLASERPNCSSCRRRIEVGESHVGYYDPKSRDISMMHSTCSWGGIMDEVVGDFYERNASMKKGAPFAGYDDFADCVSKNQDKDNPEAYCGAIKNKVEGRRLRPSQYRSIR